MKGQTMPNSRFRVVGNGCGGYKITQGGRQIGGGYSHKRNAIIACERLNGERDAGVNDWREFYGANAAAAQ
jgi:hypothetical protein